MKIRALTRIVSGCTWKVQRRLLFNFAMGGARAVRAFERRRKQGRPFFPAFTMISLTNRCNLQCRGCWVEQTKPAQALSVEQLNGVVTTARRYGSNFFGILGGEPHLLEVDIHADDFAAELLGGNDRQRPRTDIEEGRVVCVGELEELFALHGLGDSRARQDGGRTQFRALERPRSTTQVVRRQGRKL